MFSFFSLFFFLYECPFFQFLFFFVPFFSFTSLFYFLFSPSFTSSCRIRIGWRVKVVRTFFLSTTVLYISLPSAFCFLSPFHCLFFILPYLLTLLSFSSFFSRYVLFFIFFVSLSLSFFLSFFLFFLFLFSFFHFLFSSFFLLFSLEPGFFAGVRKNDTNGPKKFLDLPCLVLFIYR